MKFLTHRTIYLDIRKKNRENGYGNRDQKETFFNYSTTLDVSYLSGNSKKGNIHIVDWLVLIFFIFLSCNIFIYYFNFSGDRTTCAACACNLPEIEPYVRNQLAEELLISLQIPCEFAKNGCGKKLDPGSMEIHKKDCKLRTIDCILPNCPSKIIINYRGLTQHLARNHEFDIFKKLVFS